MIGFKRALLTAALVALAAVAARPAAAQGDAAANFPNKPIRVIVGFAAGGGNDIFARLVGQKLSEILKQPVVIENKPGAGGRISAEYVAGQPADGYTLMVGASGMMSIAAATLPKLSYHPTKTFIPLAMIANFPLIMVVPVNNPAKTVKELVEWAKAHPDKANYATTSPAFTITSELLKLKSGMPGVAITYKSSNEMLLSVIGEQTLLAIADGPPTVPMVQGRQGARAGRDRRRALVRASGRAEHGGSRLPRRRCLSVERVLRAGRNAARHRRQARGRAAPGDPGSGCQQQAQGHGGQSGRRQQRGVPQA